MHQNYNSFTKNHIRSTQYFITMLLVVMLFACNTDAESLQPSSVPIYPASEISSYIKKSSSGICHDDASRSFSRTKNYKAFSSMEKCLSSGGRAYKGYQTQFDKSLEEAKAEGRSFVSLYDRGEWRHWTDDDGDCQNTRHELLIATSQSDVTFKTENSCVVQLGSWFDPYSGNTFGLSTELDLDHIVPLKFAHGHGGDVWSKERKETFANDIENLLLVSSSLNRQKGAKGIDEWLPPNHAYRCEYIGRFNAIMSKYELAYIPSEQRVVDKMMKACQM